MATSKRVGREASVGRACRRPGLRLQTSLGNALIWTKGYHAPDTTAAFARARELASREEDASERFSAYYGLWTGHRNRGEPAPMREMAGAWVDACAKSSLIPMVMPRNMATRA